MVYNLNWRMRHTNLEITEDNLIYRVEKGPNVFGEYVDNIYYLSEEGVLMKNELKTDLRDIRKYKNKPVKYGSYLSGFFGEASSYIPILFGIAALTFISEDLELKDVFLNPGVYMAWFGSSVFSTLMRTDSDDIKAYDILRKKRKDLWKDSEGL